MVCFEVYFIFKGRVEVELYVVNVGVGWIICGSDSSGVCRRSRIGIRGFWGVIEFSVRWVWRNSI